MDGVRVKLKRSVWIMREAIIVAAFAVCFVAISPVWFAFVAAVACAAGAVWIAPPLAGIANETSHAQSLNFDFSQLLTVEW